MKGYFGYIRVSDPKQGKGVSLQEQKDAIIRYATKNNLTITDWFEEQRTAAKRGRPVFTDMMNQLKSHKAQGVIIHKIDRSARNLKDWAEIADLMDTGINVYFAHESLDLQARSGRLSADIQAVIAADYIRNLREESIKGIYGRLKQGIYPFRAPLGYIDTGAGNPKTIDPIKGPLLRRLFELYATGRYSLYDLAHEAEKIGLTSVFGRMLHANTLSNILKNPFYIGIMRIKGQSFPGKHKLLVRPSLFKKVQEVFSGKRVGKTRVHEFFFKRLITCKHCQSIMTGEFQKGHTYYRCHTRNCPSKVLRQDRITEQVFTYFESFSLLPGELKQVQELLLQSNSEQETQQQEMVKALDLQISSIEQRLERLTDALIDVMIDKETYNRRNATLLQEKRELEEKRSKYAREKGLLSERLNKLFELMNSLKNKVETAKPAVQREFVEMTTSNLVANGYNVEISMKSPFQEVIFRRGVFSGGRKRALSRKNASDVDNISNAQCLILDVNDTTPLKIKQFTRKELKDLIQALSDILQQGLDKPYEFEIYDPGTEPDL